MVGRTPGSRARRWTRLDTCTAALRANAGPAGLRRCPVRAYRPGMSAPAAYDAYADWYEEFVRDSWPYMDRVRLLLADLLGPGTDRCLDLCCGGGAHAATIAGLGWTPLGVDLSLGQLRHARGRLTVVAG